MRFFSPSLSPARRPARRSRAASARRLGVESLEERLCLSLPAGWSTTPGGDADMRSAGVSYSGATIAPTQGSYMLWMSTTGATTTDAFINGLGERGTAGTIVRGP